MSIRLRVAALSTALMLALLLTIGTGIYVTLMRSLDQQIDARLWNNFISYVNDTRLVQYKPEGIIFRQPNIDPFQSPGLYMQVADSDGTVSAFAPYLGTDHISIPPAVRARNRNGERVFFNGEFHGNVSRILSAPLRDVSGNLVATVQVAEPMSAVHDTLSMLRWLLFGGFGAGLLAAAIGGYVLAGRSVRPLSRITATARAIGRSGDLRRRIDPPGTRDEVGQLAETFNQMLERLEDVFAAEQRFVADASHELRTPLTVLRGNVDILKLQAASGRVESRELMESLTDLGDEAERMSRLVQSLLTLARADGGWRPVLGTVALDQIASDAARIAAPLGIDHHFEVQIPEAIDVEGDADQLKQLILILLDNAFVYTPPHGTVELSLHDGAGGIELAVRDHGPGIPPDELDRIFDRFYRSDSTRTRATGGAGLGLAIARWIVECHEGSIGVENNQDGCGTTFTVHLPHRLNGSAGASERPENGRVLGERVGAPLSLVSALARNLVRQAPR
jgi:signal transduction histidine kinase